MRPSIGRIVHYVDNGKHCPAIIIDLNLNDTVDLVIFKDPNRWPKEGQTSWHAYAVRFDDINKYSGTWHWPEREE